MVSYFNSCSTTYSHSYFTTYTYSSTYSYSYSSTYSSTHSSTYSSSWLGLMATSSSLLNRNRLSDNQNTFQSLIHLVMVCRYMRAVLAAACLVWRGEVR